MQLDLQISQGNWHKGLTQASHLSNFFLTEPALASQVVTRVYNKMNGYKTALSFLTTGNVLFKKLTSIFCVFNPVILFIYNNPLI